MEEKINKVKEEKQRPKDIKEVDEQLEYIKKVLDDEDYREDETDIEMDLHTRLINRHKFIEEVSQAKNQRKGEFWITVPPKLNISKLKPTVTRDQAKIEFYVYEWDEEDHSKKKKHIQHTEFILSDGTVKKIPTNGEPITKYKVEEIMPRNMPMDRSVYDILKRTNELQKKIAEGKIRIRK